MNGPQKLGLFVLVWVTLVGSGIAFELNPLAGIIVALAALGMVTVLALDMVTPAETPKPT